MFNNIIRVVPFVAVMAGLSACSGTTSLPASCTQLDYEGDPAKPASVTLTCDDGDKVVIPGPINPGDSVGGQIEPAATTSGAVAGPSKILHISSEQGDHYVWYYLMTQSGEFRVWHDDQLIERTARGEITTSKIAIRDFKDLTAETKYLGW